MALYGNNIHTCIQIHSMILRIYIHTYIHTYIYICRITYRIQGFFHISRYVFIDSLKIECLHLKFHESIRFTINFKSSYQYNYKISITFYKFNFTDPNNLWNSWKFSGMKTTPYMIHTQIHICMHTCMYVYIHRVAIDHTYNASILNG